MGMVLILLISRNFLDVHNNYGNKQKLGNGGGLSEEEAPDLLILQVTLPFPSLHPPSAGVKRGMLSLYSWQGLYPTLSTTTPALTASPPHLLEHHQH